MKKKLITIGLAASMALMMTGCQPMYSQRQLDTAVANALAEHGIIESNIPSYRDNMSDSTPEPIVTPEPTLAPTPEPVVTEAPVEEASIAEPEPTQTYGMSSGDGMISGRIPMDTPPPLSLEGPFYPNDGSDVILSWNGLEVKYFWPVVETGTGVIVMANNTTDRDYRIIFMDYYLDTTPIDLDIKTLDIPAGEQKGTSLSVQDPGMYGIYNPRAFSFRMGIFPHDNLGEYQGTDLAVCALGWKPE